MDHDNDAVVCWVDHTHSFPLPPRFRSSFSLQFRTVIWLRSPPVEFLLSRGEISGMTIEQCPVPCALLTRGLDVNVTLSLSRRRSACALLCTASSLLCSSLDLPMRTSFTWVLLSWKQAKAFGQVQATRETVLGVGARLRPTPFVPTVPTSPPQPSTMEKRAGYYRRYSTDGYQETSVPKSLSATTRRARVDSTVLNLFFSGLDLIAFPQSYRILPGASWAGSCRLPHDGGLAQGRGTCPEVPSRCTPLVQARRRAREAAQSRPATPQTPNNTAPDACARGGLNCRTW